MEKFEGFTPQDFIFFLEWSSDYRRVVKQKMTMFGGLVYNQLPEQIRLSFKRNEALSIKEEVPRSFYSMGKAYEDRTNFQLCGLGISLDLTHLSFNAIIRGGSYMDSKPVGRLYQKISNETDQFLDLLSSYGGSYELHIFKRLPSRGTQIKPDHEIWEDICSFNLGLVNMEMAEYILAVLEQDKLPGIRLTLNIDAGHSILEDVEKLTLKAVSSIQQEYRLLQYLEN
ncbi:MAG: hypothetical protein PHN32_05505 [Actinomycetota bacterium]|nr:hypothetical protein [Actinomycetota bacterium]